MIKEKTIRIIRITKHRRDKYCCQLCNYVVITSKNKCEHRFCDYCFNTMAYSNLTECIFCELTQVFK